MLTVAGLVRRAPRRLTAVVVALCLLLYVHGCSALPGSVVRLEVSSAAGEELRFVPERLIVPASTRAALTFSNGSSLPHNVVLLLPTEIGTWAIVAPGATDSFEFEAPAGSYRFVCTIHEGMEGTLEAR